MNKINIKNWQEFTIEDLFETKMLGGKKQVPTGASVKIKDLEEGVVPRITVTGINNGITGYYQSNSKNYKVYENFISVSFLGTIFYQPNQASLDMKVHCLKPLRQELNLYTASFLVSVIRNAITKFKYIDQLSSTTIVDLRFKLPAVKTPEGEITPDWKYMETYMKEIENLASQKLSDLSKIIGGENSTPIEQNN